MKKFTPTNIKGAVDYAPSTQVMRNRVIGVLKTNFEQFGYLPLETAQLNYLDLLTYKYEDNAEIVREIYKLKDQGDRDLGLRFDLTVPFCKFIAMNRNIRMPFKRYEIGKVWRNGPVKLGRTREFYQCDVDCVGLSGSHIEAEIIMLAVKIFTQIGIEPVIKIGNRKNLVDAIENAGLEINKALEILDKDGKVDIKEPAKDLHLFEILEKMQIAKYCEWSPYLARGLNIYTGTVWEVYDKAGRITGALGAGGRYDDIIGNFIDNGQKYPAVGISFGLEPITAILSTEEVATVDLMIIPMGTEIESQQIAEGLRKKGLRVLVNLTGKGVGKCFEYADVNKIPYVAVVGENELKTNKIVAKRMSDGQQIPLEDL